MIAYSDDTILELIGARDELGIRALLLAHGPHVRVLLLETFGARQLSVVDSAIEHATQLVWHQHHSYDPSRGSLREWFYALARAALLGLMRIKPER